MATIGTNGVDYTWLAAQWNAQPAGTAPLTILATINAMTLPGTKVDTPASSVAAYLMLNMKWSALQAYAATPPAGAVSNAVMAAKELVAYMAMPERPPFQTSNPAVFNQLSSMLDALVSDPNSGIVAADQTALLALANGPTVPAWSVPQAAGGGGLRSPPNIHDAIAAGLLTEAQAKALG